MRVHCLGNGESQDKERPNNAHLVVSENSSILLDCGRQIPGRVRDLGLGITVPQIIYCSHGHLDHYCGIDKLCRWLWENNREEILIISQGRLRDRLLYFSGANYYYDTGEFAPSIGFAEAIKGRTIEVDSFKLSFALTTHSIPNLAIRIDNGKHTVCYSGDGQFTKASKRLYKNADLLIHEAYTYETPVENHACMVEVIAMAEAAGVKELWLTHLKAALRKSELAKLREIIKSSNIKIIFPEPGEIYES